MRQSGDEEGGEGGEDGRGSGIGEKGRGGTGISFYIVCEVGMVVVAVLAGDVKQTFPGGCPADFVQGVTISGDIDKFLWADVEVQAEKSLKLAAGDEASFGQLGDGYPPFCLMDGFDEGQGLPGGKGEAVSKKTIE